MRRLLSVTTMAVTLAIVGAGHGTAGQTQYPSFPCVNVTQEAQIAICNNAQLAALDVVQFQGYQQLRKILGRASANRLTREFLKRRNDCGSNVECIAEAQVATIHMYRDNGAIVTLPYWVTSSGVQLDTEPSRDTEDTTIVNKADSKTPTRPSASVAQTDSATERLPTFGEFKVASIYHGKTHYPQFNGRDKSYRDLRTRIQNALRDGPVFSGKYSVLQFGCGTQCSVVLVASNQTGQIFEFPLGGETVPYLELSFRLDSSLMIVQWADSESSNCYIEYFNWAEEKFNSVRRIVIGDTDKCFETDLSHNIVQ